MLLRTLQVNKSRKLGRRWRGSVKCFAAEATAPTSAPLAAGARATHSSKVALAVFDSAGNLVLADSSNHRVQVLHYLNGTHVRTIGSDGAGAGQFHGPLGVAFDAAGHIVVVYWNKIRLQVMCYSDSARIRTIGRSA